MPSTLETLALDGIDFGGANYVSVVMADDPRAFYPSGDATNLAGGNGTLVNSPTTGVPGPIAARTATSFTAASSQRVDCPLPTAVTDNWTLEAWVKLPNLTVQDALFATNGGDRSPPGGWAIGINNGSGTGTGLKLVGLSPGTAWINTGYTFADTNWHHVVLLRRAGTVEMYIDKANASPAANPGFSAPAASFLIAADKNGSDVAFFRYFNGSVAGVAVYDTALSLARISAHYDAATIAPTPWKLQGFDPGIPPKLPEWAQGGDSDGGWLIRDPLADNRVATLRLRVGQQPLGGGMDTALSLIAALQQKLEECENQIDGLPMTWTPAGSTKTLTMRVLSGAIEDLPMALEGDDAGWLLPTGQSPLVVAKLTCQPFLYGADITYPAASAGAVPFATVSLSGVPGDVPAEGKLVVTDTGATVRNYIEWGLESRFLDPATSLLVDSDDMVTTGYAGAGNTRTGAYDPNASGNNVIRATLFSDPVVVAATGNLGHVGTFRVKARVYASATNQKVRLSWQEGDGPYRANAWVIPPANGAFSEVDLGLVSIPPAKLGTQRWQGRVEAKTSGAVGVDTIDVDYLVLMPAGEGYGRVRGGLRQGLTIATARDGFNQSSGNLSGKSADVGGVYAGFGAATDFTVDSAAHVAPRSTTTDTAAADPHNGRFVILTSATSQTNVTVQVNVLAGTTTTDSHFTGVSARWTDINNQLVAVIQHGASPFTDKLWLRVFKAVGGTWTQLFSNVVANPLGGPLGGTTFTASDWYTIRLTVDSTGYWAAYLRPRGQTMVNPTAQGYDAVLATGGTLQTGKFGILNQGSTVARQVNLDNFLVWTPLTAVALNSGKQAEIRSDGEHRRQDSTGNLWGPAPSYRGSRFLVPEAGDRNRPTRVIVKAHATDIEATSSDAAANLSAQVVVTPRYIAAPF